MLRILILIPEQDWETANLAVSPYGTDPTQASIGFTDGQAAGSASPLTWSAAQYVRLLLDIQAGRPLEQPVATAQRYILHQQGTTSLTITSPGNNTAISTGSVTVTGTATPGDTVYVAATNTDQHSATTTFKLQVANLDPTFGRPLGAQLVDVYVHDPNAATTSTSAAYASRNYGIASGSAWSRLLEVQGFGQAYEDASGNNMGTITLSANAISRYITFSVPTASLGGTPGSGWGFTVTLTGQDGYSSDQARAFTATSGGYSFGVCAGASSDPYCTVNPDTVPKVMDTLTPPGVSQSTELDYTLGPVVLQDVVIP